MTMRHARLADWERVAIEGSRPPAERLGFVPVLRFTLWTRHT